jgi:adenosine deaminase
MNTDDTAGPGAERLRRLVDRLPKAELHLHLEGAVPWSLIRSWSPDPLPERPAWWGRDHRFRAFGDFISVMRPCWKPYLDRLERIEAAAAGIFEGLVAQNVRYVELSFGLGAYDFPVSEVVAAIQQAGPDGLQVRVIAGISRDLDPEWMQGLAREALDTEALDGIDLHGDEGAGCLEDWATVYREARERGLVTKAHAGEFGGPEKVRATVETLGVRRVEHGIAAAQDAIVIQMLKDTGVALDVCPWSNVKLGAVRSLGDHPIPVLHRSGVCVTVGTDDPTAFGQTLSDELVWLGTETGMAEAEIVQIIKNGFESSAMPEAEQAKWVALVDDGVRNEAQGAE